MRKSIALKKYWQNQNALSTAGLPEELKAKEVIFKKEILELNSKLDQMLSMPSKENDPELSELRNQLFEKKKSFATLTSALEDNYPKYYSLKYARQSPTIEEVINEMDEGSVLIEYVLLDSSLYSIVFNRDKARIYKKLIPVDFRETVSHLHTSLAVNDGKFEYHAYSLYKDLVSDLIPHFGPDTKRLTIVPDGIMAYIPFEALITEKPEF